MIQGIRRTDGSTQTPGGHPLPLTGKPLTETPVVVKNGPGFLVNRILMLYLNEALLLLGEGVKIDDAVLHVETTDLGALGRRVPVIARDTDARITAFQPEDASLESVFRYLVRR